MSETQKVSARTDIIREGEKPRVTRVILSGFACHYRLLENGARQITGFLLPGDFCDLNVFILSEMDHTIATLSDCTVAHVYPDTVTEWMNRPAIARACWWSTLVSEAILRERVADVGRRTASARTAHILCELWMRLKTVGLVDGDSYSLPLTQTDLADALALSPVYLNKTLAWLKTAGIITFQKNQLVIRDVPRLIEIGGFNANYLHLT